MLEKDFAEDFDINRAFKTFIYNNGTRTINGMRDSMILDKFRETIHCKNQIHFQIIIEDSVCTLTHLCFFR